MDVATIPELSGRHVHQLSKKNIIQWLLQNKQPQILHLLHITWNAIHECRWFPPHGLQGSWLTAIWHVTTAIWHVMWPPRFDMWPRFEQFHSEKSVRIDTCTYLLLDYSPFQSRLSPLTDTLHSPNVSCFSHIHTLPFFLESSWRVSHQTTSSHKHDHTYTPPTFQTQTSHHSPHPSILPSFQPDTPLPLHPKSLSISIQIHPHHSSSIHNISSIQFSLNTDWFQILFEIISIFLGCIDFWNHILL